MERATFTDEAELRFDDRGYSFYQKPAEEQVQRQEREFVCELSYLTFLRAQGAEAIDFLHGQLTNDLEHLPKDNSQRSGYCTPKGRLLCIFRIHHDNESLLLQAHQDVIASTVQRLRKYIMRTKVELGIDESISSFGVVGQECSITLQKIVGFLPAEKDACSSGQGISIICHSATNPARYQVIGRAPVLKPLWQTMSDSLPKLGSWAWASMDIEQGLATIFVNTSEQFVPQMVNMDITNAVNFDKGCYPGQEIVARMHYLGKLKTRMILGYVDTASPPLPGDKLYTVDNEQSIGMVVDAQPGSVGYDILATARLENVQHDDLCLGNSTQTPVRLGQLPYQLDRAKQKQA